MSGSTDRYKRQQQQQRYEYYTRGCNKHDQLSFHAHLQHGQQGARMVPETPAPHNTVVSSAGQYWRIYFHESQAKDLAVRPVRGTVSTAQAEIYLRHLCEKYISGRRAEWGLIAQYRSSGRPGTGVTIGTADRVRAQSTAVPSADRCVAPFFLFGISLEDFYTFPILVLCI